MNTLDLSRRIALLDHVVRQMLAEDLPAQLARLHAALREDDLELARREVHAVHGAAAFCKLDELRAAAVSLEQALTNNEKNAGHIRAFENSVLGILHALGQE